MMVAVKDNSPQLTPEEYFVWEEKQQENYEYIDGQVYAMGGGSVTTVALLSGLQVSLTPIWKTLVASLVTQI